ncbi:hypothetical protein CHS0354_025491 [Potamilus streckersoni]|uniref:Adenosine 3'-phospho 5'-phosphosulfate transporter 2 n=1 Tax=Potamilus streckersoni TaxID=2493646 RepID=A0AAE0W6F7_9BIVA|nr:hypothetical protein CHS0354_025491 [Potamilus streckersoni]
MSRFSVPVTGLRSKYSNGNPGDAENFLKGGSSTAIDIGSVNQTPQNEVWILCLNLTHSSTFLQFIVCSGAVFFFFLIYGYMQELLFQLPGFQPFGWYLTLVQFAYYTLFGLAELVPKKDRERRIPLRMYALLSFLTVATMGLSNTSVGYLNYPTQVIFKCCKLIPVMIGGVLIQGKKYSMIDVTAVLCMVIGLALFTLADNSVLPNFNAYGVLLISLALVADGAIGNVQEQAMKQYGSSNAEVVLYSYSIGFLYILFGLIVSGTLMPAVRFFHEHPVETYGYAAIFSLTGYLGLIVVLTLVKRFGALMSVTVTTCRKAVTILLSFLFFTKPFTFQYVWSGLIVILGIYLNIYSKNKASWDMKMASIWAKVKQDFGLHSKPVHTKPGTVV